MRLVDSGTMKGSELLDQAIAISRANIARAEALFKAMSDEEWNRPGPPSQWSPGQIFEHLNLVNRPYGKVYRQVGPQLAAGDSEVKHNWTARMILKGAGPSGNAPAPKPVRPKPGPTPRSVFSDWKALEEEFIGYCESYRGKDIASLKIASPLLSIIRFSVASSIAIELAHTERHLQQIEAMLGKR